MRRFLALIFILCSSASIFAAAKRPFTFEDMMKLKRVGEPEVSPDGKWVIFSVVDVDLAANTKTPHIWIVPLNGGQEKAGVPHVSPNLRDVGEEEREIIAEQDADRPRWSPDGKRFAFLSTKEGGSQVWIADFDSNTGAVGRTRRLTAAPGEAGGELWSPDGKYILFVSDVYPECGGTSAEEQECNKKKFKDAEQSKVKAMIFDHLLYRHWNSYKEGRRSHIFVYPADGPGFPIANTSGIVEVYSGPYTYDDLRDLTPGDFDAPVFSVGGQDTYAFSPDGQEICYASNHDKNPAASTNNDLWLVPVNIGADASSAQIIAMTKNITADNPASDSTPLYSPDGKYIAYRAQQRPGYESDRFRLMLYDRKTGEKKNLTEDFDHWVGTFTWAPNSKLIYFASETTGGQPLQSVGLDSGVIAFVQPSNLGNDDKPGIAQRKIPMAVGDYYDDIALTSDGTTLLCTQMSLEAPIEIHKIVLRKETEEPLTHFNQSLLSQISMSPLQSFWFTGAYGDKVQGFLLKPPNFDPNKKYPVKFIIHGGPEVPMGDEWSYRWNDELFAANGYVVIIIHFHGTPGYGQKFIDAINGDWGGAPYEDLMKGLDFAEQTYPFIDKDRECALGASYGGYMINWIEGHTDRFKCLVTHDGMFNAESAWGSTEELWFNNWEFKGTPYDNRELYQKWSPHQYAKNFKTPMLVVHGQKDYRLDVSEGFQLFTTLQMRGVPSKMLYFPDEGHWVLKPQNSQLWYKTVNGWIDQWIGNKQ
jgi:dipeptidyl aminopeptidase/acylaminoacyl peptidase